MIRLLVFGDSFTEGTELWEEQNVPGYSSMTAKEALCIANNDPEIISLRRTLSYTGVIKNLRPDWKIVNLGKAGASQTMIVSSAYTQYSVDKKQHSTDKIICIVQDTFRTRYTYYSNIYRMYQGLNTDHLDIHLRNHPESKDLIEFSKKYHNEEIFATQFYANSFGLMEFFKKNNVPYINFSFLNHKGRYDYDYPDDPNSILDIMKTEYMKYQTFYPNGAIKRVCDYYNVKMKDALLPSWHLKRQYHELIGNDIVAYIENNLL